MNAPTRSSDAALPRPRVVTAHPLNVETPLSSLDGGLTSTEVFYVRSNFPAPELDADRWRLRVHGAVDEPRTWTLSELKALASTRRRVTLECAGNGRDRVEPQPPGTPWGLGAAGTAEFAGVRLRDVLDASGIRPEATSCVFSGADEGEVEDGSHVRFQRSLSVEHARGSGSSVEAPVLAWEMNGAPLTRHHGFPVRLVVPRWYAVASVKWLVDIEVTTEPFAGWFQADRYMYRGDGEATPVTTMRVRSLITGPADGDRVAAGPTVVRGVAWSGEAPISRVEVQVDEGPWVPGTLSGESRAGVAVAWECRVELAGGAREVRARAVDEADRGQPERSAWNALGYGNNGLHRIAVDVV